MYLVSLIHSLISLIPTEDGTTIKKTRKNLK